MKKMNNRSFFAIRETGRHFSFSRLLPVLITFTALSLGLTAVQKALNGKFQAAFLLIFVAGLFDGIDGRVARAFGTDGIFGANLDSLADMVSFGVASPLVLYLWSTKNVHLFGWACVLIFSVSMVIRLARFNTEIFDKHDVAKKDYKYGFFKGMPAPAAAVANLIPMCISIEFDIHPEKLKYIAIANSIAVSAFMISSINTPSLKNIRIKKNRIFWTLLISNVAVVMATLEPIKTILFLYCLYLASIPILSYYSKIESDKQRTKKEQ